MSGELEKYNLELNAGLVRLSDVEAHPPEFLCYPYIRRNNWNGLFGVGSTGKTSIIYSLISAITNGQAPNNFPGVINLDGPRSVIYLGKEDGLSEYRYYMNIAGVDTTKVLMIGSSVVNLGNISAIEKMFVMHKPMLLVIDPIQSFLPQGIDMNATSDLRPILDGVGDLAEKHQVTLIVLMHANKNEKTDNMYRASGSMDLINRCRSVLMTGFTPEGEHCVAHVKTNGAPAGPVNIFHFNDDGKLIWDGEDITLDASEIKATKPRRRAARAVDPCVQLALALVAQTGSWMGSASDAVAQAPRFGITAEISATAFGKRVRLGNIRGVKVTEDRRRDGRRLILERCDGDGYQPTLP